METIVTGILLGGTYALVALGLTLQYGVSRIMNLANGETLVAACFIAFWLFTSYQVNPLWGLLVIAPVAFVMNWAIYMLLLRPLVDRAKNSGHARSRFHSCDLRTAVPVSGPDAARLRRRLHVIRFSGRAVRDLRHFLRAQPRRRLRCGGAHRRRPLSVSLQDPLRHRGTRGGGQSRTPPIWSVSMWRARRPCLSRLAAR